MDLKLRVAICDDEKYFREEIKRLVEQYLKEKKIIFCIDLFTSGLEFCSDGHSSMERISKASDAGAGALSEGIWRVGHQRSDCPCFILDVRHLLV